MCAFVILNSSKEKCAFNYSLYWRNSLMNISSQWELGENNIEYKGERYMVY